MRGCACSLHMGLELAGDPGVEHSRTEQEAKASCSLSTSQQGEEETRNSDTKTLMEHCTNITAAGAVDREFLYIFLGFFGPAPV